MISSEKVMSPEWSRQHAQSSWLNAFFMKRAPTTCAPLPQDPEKSRRQLQNKSNGVFSSMGEPEEDVAGCRCRQNTVFLAKPTFWRSDGCTWKDTLRRSWKVCSTCQHCEKCDWMTGKSAGQNFHENRAKFDQKSSFNRSARRASAIPLASGRDRP